MSLFFSGYILNCHGRTFQTMKISHPIFCPTARCLIFLKSTHLAGSISGQNIFRPNRQHLQNRPDLSKIEKNRQKMRKSDTPIISRKWPIFQKISEMCSKTPKDTHISILCYNTLFYGRKKNFWSLIMVKKMFFW